MKIKKLGHIGILLLLIPGSWSVLINIRLYETRISRMHNYYRLLERSSNMKLMCWDHYLATRAAKWSENCYWGHQRRGLGENLTYMWSTSPMTPSYVIRKSIEGWWKEKYIWRWSTKCGSACHYTQVVWAKTSEVGCALSKCRYLRTAGSPIRNAYYFVCFYSPPGNYLGQYPFIYGKRCRRCDKSDACCKGLCCSRRRRDNYKYLPYGW